MIESVRVEIAVRDGGGTVAVVGNGGVGVGKYLGRYWFGTEHGTGGSERAERF